MPLDLDLIIAAGICDYYSASKSATRISYNASEATETYKARFK